MPISYNHDHESEITLFGEVNFRNTGRRFGIKTDDRRRHMYIIGKTGMGKTTLMENMILADVYAGHGCCYIDPHGDTAEKLIDFIPSHRINDVIYYNPADTAFPMGFNILETANEDQKPLVASGLMGVFKKIWPDVWSARMEHILNNCVLALLDYPGATLLGINRLLVDKDYRTRVIAKIRDPLVKTFWVAEFASWSEKYATEAIAPVQNKVGQFLSSFVIRNIVAQVKSTIDVRRIMDEGKILIVNLSKGRIGEDNMRLLGGMLITKIQLAAQERQNIPELDRRDFYMYVDEFQNFANESFASILSEARKYRLNLTIAHQYIEQLDEEVTPAVFGNVGTIIVMRVGAADAEAMETEFTPTFLPEDLVNLAKFQMYLKLMVDGVSTPPFSANTLPPIAKRTGNADKVVQVSRERYAEPRASIEEKVLKWSGMELSGSQSQDESFLSMTSETPQKESTTSVTGSIQYPAIKTAEELEQAETSTEPAKPKEYLTIKPDRLAAITAAVAQAQQQKKKKPEYPHTCTRCGKVWHLAIQLDPSRPMYCPECRPIVAEERKKFGHELKIDKRSAPAPEEGEAIRLTDTESSAASEPNRPRVVRSASVESKVEAVEDRAPAIVTPKKSFADSVGHGKGKGDVRKHKADLEQRAGDVSGSNKSVHGAAPIKRIPPPSVPKRSVPEPSEPSEPNAIDLGDLLPPMDAFPADEPVLPRVVRQTDEPQSTDDVLPPVPTSRAKKINPGKKVRFDPS